MLGPSKKEHDHWSWPPMMGHSEIEAKNLPNAPTYEAQPKEDESAHGFLASDVAALCRPSLDAVLELLGLLLPILAEVDRPLHAHIEASGVQPFFGLSWYITWFAHNLPQLAQAARLFDLFLASHPLMPLYASAAVLIVRTPLPTHPSAAPVSDIGGVPCDMLSD